MIGMGELLQLAIHLSANHVANDRRRRRALRKALLKATEMGEYSRYPLRQVIRLSHEHASHSPKVDRMEEVLKVNVEYPPFSHMLLGISPDVSFLREPVNAGLGPVNRLEDLVEFLLQYFDVLRRRVDATRFSRFLGYAKPPVPLRLGSAVYPIVERAILNFKHLRDVLGVSELAEGILEFDSGAVQFVGHSYNLS